MADLEAAVKAERDSETPCGKKQKGNASLVCVRAKGHDGPHVGEADGQLLQFA